MKTTQIARMPSGQYDTESAACAKSECVMVYQMPLNGFRKSLKKPSFGQTKPHAI